jgi:hypothetical protein
MKYPKRSQNKYAKSRYHDRSLNPPNPSMCGVIGVVQRLEWGLRRPSNCCNALP